MQSAASEPHAVLVVDYDASVPHVVAVDVQGGGYEVLEPERLMHVLATARASP